MALVGEEVEAIYNNNNNNKRKQPFDDDAGLEGERIKLDVPSGENVENAPGGRLPMLHTGPGRSFLVRRNSIDKARAVLASQMIASEGWLQTCSDLVKQQKDQMRQI